VEHGREGEGEREEEVGPRRPFVDLCGMIGNGITPSVLGPLMVEVRFVPTDQSELRRFVKCAFALLSLRL